MAACLRGELVVSVVGGEATFAPAQTGNTNRGSGRRPIEKDTLFMAYSLCKGVVATAVLRLVDLGLLDYEEPVCNVWPEFAGPHLSGGSNAKAKVTVAQALSHRAGLGPRSLPPLARSLAAFLWGGWAAHWNVGLRWIESLQPQWPPGQQASYHLVSFSWIAGGIVEGALARAGTPMSISDFVQGRLASSCISGSFPHRDMWIGRLDPAERYRVARLCRVARPVQSSVKGIASSGAGGHDAAGRINNGSGCCSRYGSYLAWWRLAIVGMVWSFLRWLESTAFVFIGNSRWWQQVCLPSSNGFFTAEAVAKMYGVVATGEWVESRGGDDGHCRRFQNRALSVLLEKLGGKHSLPIRRNGTATAATAGTTDLDDGDHGADDDDDDDDGAARLSCGYNPWPDEATQGPRDARWCIGHSGMGGSTAFCDLKTGLAVCILRSAYHSEIDEPCPDTTRICQALRRELVGLS